MKKFLATVVAALGLIGATAAIASPDSDRNDLIRAYGKTFPGIALKDYVYGAYISSPDAKEQYNDIMQFPPFQTQLDMGREMWEKPFANGKTFSSCFPNGGRNVAGNYPKFDEALGKVVTFEMAINQCLKKNGETELKQDDMSKMGVLTAYARTLSDGMKMNIKVVGPMAMKAYEDGKRRFFERRGQFDFSCSICHMDNAGKRMRNEFLSPVVGQATHWPVFRSPGDDVWTLQRRYVGCYGLIRAKAPAIGGEEFNNLEYYHSFLSNGLPMKAAVFRK